MNARTCGCGCGRTPKRPTSKFLPGHVLRLPEYRTRWAFETAVEEYSRKFGEGPALLQMSGSLSELARKLRECIRRGYPLRDDELEWPPDGAVSAPGAVADRVEGSRFSRATRRDHRG